MYYSIEYSIWPSKFKNSILIGIRSKFLGNISTCICIRKFNKNGQFFLMKFGQRPCTIVRRLWLGFGANSKIHKKSIFDWNQLKLSTQHKCMYMYQKKL